MPFTRFILGLPIAAHFRHSVSHTPSLTRWIIAVGLALGLIGSTFAADPSPADQPRDPGAAILPTTPLEADLTIKARRAVTWTSGQTRRVLLDTDVQIAIGSYGFSAKRAVVFITPDLARPGAAHQLAIYFDDAQELEGHGPITSQARRLLVTAIIQGKIKLAADRLVEQDEGNDPLVKDATDRLARHYQALAQNIQSRPDMPPLYPADVFVDRAQRQSIARGQTVEPYIPAPQPGDSQTTPTTPPLVDGGQGPTPPTVPPGTAPTPDGLSEDQQRLRLVRFSAGRIVYQEGEDESYALLVGDVRVMYHDPQANLSMSLSADRAVIFTSPGALTGGQEVDFKAIRGVYLEDNVIATNGDYTLRGPRVFYDLQTDRAVVLDAVFYTYDIKRQVPIYVRASKLKQISTSQWEAEGARLSTSEFHDPHFALGVDKLTVRQVDAGEDGQTEIKYNARHLTLEAAGIPVFYWPGVSGTAADAPLRRVSTDFDSRDGLAVKSRWDLFGLANQESPDGVDAELLVDGYTNRGPALGLDLEYDRPQAFGQADAMIMYDTGEDEPGGREEIEPENEVRGLLYWQHRHLLPDNWEISAELGYISDPTYLEEFFPGRAFTDKPWETSLYVKKQEEDWAFTFLTKYDLLEFLPQLSQLQTPGYTTEKLPELAYYRQGTPLLNDTVTWFSENRASIVRLSLPEKTPRELGFSVAESIALFGITDTTTFSGALEGAGFNEDENYRFDTRQELNVPLRLGPIDIVPFTVGRFTAYNDDFKAFSGEEDSLRFWGQGGIKLHTSISRSYDDVENRLLDVHRLRHIVEPSIHTSYAWTSIEQEKLPTYDFDVESLTEGAVVRLGMRNTLQTQRGGEGNWRSVDWIRLDTDLVLQDDQAVRESPLPQFFDYRPEFSSAGDHFWSEVAWQITDTLSSVANITHSFDSNKIEQWNIGINMDHTPRLSSFIEIRYIDHADSLLLRYGVDYLLSAKYHVSVTQSYDLEENEGRDVSILVTRRLPRMLLMMAVSYDTLAGSTSVGLSLVPEGVGGSGRPSRNPFLWGP